MGLADLHAAAGGDAHAPPKKPVDIEVKVEPLDSKHAAADVLKAVKAGDVNALEDALRRFFVAVDDDSEYEKKDEDEDEGEAE